MNKLFNKKNFSKLLRFAAITLARELNKEELSKMKYDLITSNIDNKSEKISALFIENTKTGPDVVFTYCLTFEQISIMTGLE